MGPLRHKATTLAHVATRYVRLAARGRRWSVCEYPRSGGTWLAAMLADYLDLPFVRRPSLPIVQPSVVRAHWRYSRRFDKTIYVVRDGRDALVSLYFFTLSRGQHEARLEKVLGPGFRSVEPIENMARFVELHMERPRSSSFLNWNDHVLSWAGKPNVTYARFESLHEDANAHLTEVLASLSLEVDPVRVQRAVEQSAFERVSGGRARGEEERESFYRKGIVGDWRNYFTREAAEIFDHHAGEALLRMGYEANPNWVDGYSYVA